MKPLLTLVLLWAGVLPYLRGQEALVLPEARFPTYDVSTLPEDLYAFPEDPTIVNLVDTILRRTGHERNFTMVAANVPTVLPVVSDRGRYLLYNQVFLNFQTDPYHRQALLARAVGHHVLAHDFTAGRRRAESWEAHVFTGFALFRLGVPEPFLEVFVEMEADDLPVKRLAEAEKEDRLLALREGFKQAESYAFLQPHAAFNDEGKGDAVPGLPEFPFPPPPASANREVTSCFTNYGTMAQVNRHLCYALEAHGYYERRYYYVPGGFALVTALEQFHHPGGEPKAEPGRWSARPVRQEKFSLGGYLRALFTADPAHYRVFVFVVTDEVWAPDPDRVVASDDARDWLRRGAITFPSVLGQRAFSTNSRGHTVTALVYEFIKDEGDGEVKTSQPSDLDGRTHLSGAGLLDGLRRE